MTFTTRGRTHNSESSSAGQIAQVLLWGWVGWLATQRTPGQVVVVAAAAHSQWYTQCEQD